MDKTLIAEMMTIEEVAQKLKVNPRTVYRAIQKGQLPAIRIGRLLRISVSAYQDYISVKP